MILSQSVCFIQSRCRRVLYVILHYNLSAHLDQCTLIARVGELLSSFFQTDHFLSIVLQWYAVRLLRYDRL